MLAVIVLGLLAFAYVTVFLGPSGALAIDVTAEERGLMMIAAVVFVALEYPRALLSARRRFRDASEWLDRPTPPTLAEARAFTSLPRVHARSVFIEWFAVTALGTAIHALEDPALRPLLVLFLGGLVFGLHMAGIVYVTVERSLRPSLGRLADDGVALERGEPGIGLRLFLTWGLCAGVATFGAALIIGWSGDTESVDFAAAVLPLAAFVILEGGGLTWWAVRGLSTSVHELQAGLARVENGDLAVRLPVDDRTELGALRRSFNAMVHGLRDRDLLQRILDGQVGADVAARTLRDGVQLRGERHHASVLFVDMIGSTPFAERVGPEEAIAVLNGYFDRVVQRVTSEGGNVLQFQGDGAVCVFGAPSPLPGHEIRALRAARLLHEDLIGFRDEHCAGFDAAISVSTGIVVVGHVGNADRFSYTVIGDVVNEAARLVDEAKGRQERVLAASASVARAADEARHWRQAGHIELRGRSQRTAVLCPASPPVDGDRVGQQRDLEPAPASE